MRRYVIIGTGAAGLSAAETIRRQDPAAEILPFSEEPHGFYSRPGLAYYLTGELPEAQLFPFSTGDLSRLDINLRHERVVRIHPDRHQVALASGRLVPYDRLLIATGASAVPGKAPGMDLEGVVKLDNLEDARRILRLARHARSAIVVGGGITALEIVEGLRARGVKTNYFLRRERYWGNVLDEAESRIVEHRLQEEGVQIHYHTDLAEIIGKSRFPGRQKRVAGVLTQDGRRVPCDLVAIAIGVRPRLDLAVAAGLKTERGILVDEYMQTSHPDIYAAGDVAQVYDPFSGKSILDSLWGPARDQGRIAGLNMAGQVVPYLKPVPFNVTRLAGLTTTIIGTVGQGRDEDLAGIARGDSETWRKIPDAIAAQDCFEINRLRLLVGKQTLLGAILMGDQTLSQPIHRLVNQQADISQIREQLLQPGAPLADLIVDFWTEWKRNHAS